VGCSVLGMVGVVVIGDLLSSVPSGTNEIAVSEPP